MVRRPGTDLSADLFLDPPPGDSFQKDFMVTVMYEDGQQANATAKAAEHSDSKLAVDLKAPAVPGIDATVYLMDDEKLFGRFEGIGPEALKLTTPWQDHLEVPLARVVGIHFGLLDRKESPQSFANRLKTRGSEDLLLAQTKDGEVVAIAGIMEGTDKDRLRFTYQGRERTLPLRLVEGLILASRPDSKPSNELRPSFTLPGGVVVSGRWKDLDTSVWKIVTAWGAGHAPAGRGRSRREVSRGKDDVPFRPQPQQGRGNPVLRPPASLAPQRQPGGRAAEDERSNLRSRPGRSFTI